MNQDRQTRVTASSPTLFRALGACILALASGCASIGTQYEFPLPAQPSATLVPKGGSVYIHNHDGKGCYQGRTELPGEKEARLQAGREVIFLYETEAPQIYETAWRRSYLVTNSVCRALVSFVPQEGAYYTITSTGAETKTDANGKEIWHYCGAAVARRNAAGTLEPVAVKKLELRQQRLACIQAVEW